MCEERKHLDDVLPERASSAGQDDFERDRELFLKLHLEPRANFCSDKSVEIAGGQLLDQ